MLMSFFGQEHQHEVERDSSILKKAKSEHAFDTAMWFAWRWETPILIQPEWKSVLNFFFNATCFNDVSVLELSACFRHRYIYIMISKKTDSSRALGYIRVLSDRRQHEEAEEWAACLCQLGWEWSSELRTGIAQWTLLASSFCISVRGHWSICDPKTES